MRGTYVNMNQSGDLQSIENSLNSTQIFQQRKKTPKDQAGKLVQKTLLDEQFVL